MLSSIATSMNKAETGCILCSRMPADEIRSVGEKYFVGGPGGLNNR
jgi:hypothetical protein